MLPQEVTPDTTYYLVLGYTAFAVLGGGYILSLFARRRKLRADQVTIKQLQEAIDE